MSNIPTLNENSIVCRTCLSIQDNQQFVSIETEHEHSNIGSMLQFLMPEIDIYVSANPVICLDCFKSLVQMYNFKKQCLSIENSIKNYLSRNNMQHFNNVNLVGVLKDGPRIDSNISNSDRQNAPLSEDKVEALNNGYIASHDEILDTYADANIMEVVIEQNLSSEVESEDNIFDIFSDSNDSHVLNETSQTLLNTKTTVESKPPKKLQPILLNSNLPKVELLDIYTFQNNVLGPMGFQFTNNKSRIVVKFLEVCCTSCPYSTVYRSNLNRHMLEHNTDKKVECDKCGHKCATNYQLQRHLKNSKFCDPYLKTYEKRKSKNS